MVNNAAVWKQKVIDPLLKHAHSKEILKFLFLLAAAIFRLSSSVEVRKQNLVDEILITNQNVTAQFLQYADFERIIKFSLINSFLEKNPFIKYHILQQKEVGNEDWNFQEWLSIFLWFFFHLISSHWYSLETFQPLFHLSSKCSLLYIFFFFLKILHKFPKSCK